MIRSLAVASVLATTAALLSNTSVMSTEPMWLLLWGGTLIGVSLQLRSGFARKAASAAARRGMSQSFVHAGPAPVNRNKQSIDLPLLSHAQAAGTDGSAF
jgi:hypothetical protein